MVTPGVEFLANFTLHVLSKPVLLAVAVHYVSQRLDVPLPLWATALLAGANIPVYAMYSVWISDRRQRREAESMGARMVPTIKGKLPGNLDIMQMMIRNRIHGYLGDGLIESMEELGPVVNLRILWTDMIITIWPEHIKAMLATDFNNFEKGARFQKDMASVLGTGVFNSDGDMWKFHRGMTRPFFNKERVSHFDTIDTHAELVVSTLKSRSRAGHAIDFQDLIGRFTMDSATETLFGTCVDSLKGSIPYAHNATANAVHTKSRENTFVQAINDAMEGVAVRDERNFLWPLWEIWKEGTHDAMEVVNAFLDPIIEAAVERKRVVDAMGEEKREAQNLLDELLNSTSDPKILKDETLSIYPAICQRLRAEVIAHVGPARRPTYDDIKDMKYLRAVINEALRLYPPVPFNVRDSIEATTWPSPDPNEKPIYIPAHTITPYSVLLMQRSKDLWGPDADEFDPDRFLDERLKKYLLTNAFQFLPFNAGPRICLGQQFAYNEMSFVLIRLLQSFSAFHLDEAAFAPASRPPAEWKNAKGRKAVDRFRPRMHLTMSTLGGMWVRVTEAGEEV
ncbi:cytochrome P450 [Mycena amicta]|nr:cytochrome P450 [Mycena amicta]